MGHVVVREKIVSFIAISCDLAKTAQELPVLVLVQVLSDGKLAPSRCREACFEYVLAKFDLSAPRC